MASAIVYGIQAFTPDHVNGGFDAIVEVAYSGPDVTPGWEVRQVHVDLASGDTPTILRTKLTDAVVAEAVQAGFTVARNAVVLPAWQRGV